MAAPSIVVSHLVKRFGDVEAVRGIDFEIAPGTIFGLLGRNGAGKTTTLECCVGLSKPTDGSVRMLGLDPARPRDLALLRPRFGAQLQTTSLPEKARVGEVLELYAHYYGLRPAAAALCERVGLEGRERHPIGALSGGERQRLALALAIQHDPEIAFLDEPTAGMDAFGRRVLWGEVARLRADGKTVVLTTHYIEEAERLCNEICIVQHGLIVARDTPANLIAREGGGSTITVEADGFSPHEGLVRMGRWHRDAAQASMTPAGEASSARWVLSTSLEPGAILAEVVRAVDEQRAQLRALDLRRATLEDAFLNVTGERIADDAVEGAA
ncbi:MAG TPA: ABC transporter ATP-binding protein [Candidatus Dormibacteraeota bacterium]|nr:ABC transporter ATP-binding protein [Candidatus Dormibacteraeota bacterium]